MVCTIVYLYLCTMLHGCDNDSLQDSLLQSVNMFLAIISLPFFPTIKDKAAV